MNIREAVPSDLARLLEFEQQIVEAERPFNSLIKEQGVSYYDLKSMIDDSSACIVVVEESDCLIASGSATIRTSKASVVHEKHAHFGFMCVLPEYRGQGINAKVTERLISWSLEQGVEFGYLEVYSENKPAIRAYEKFGFKPSMLEMNIKLTQKH